MGKDGLFQTEVYKTFEADYHTIVPFQQVTNFMNEKMGSSEKLCIWGRGGTFNR